VLAEAAIIKLSDGKSDADDLFPLVYFVPLGNGADYRRALILPDTRLSGCWFVYSLRFVGIRKPVVLADHLGEAGICMEEWLCVRWI
jgi:hypothetical protein